MGFMNMTSHFRTLCLTLLICLPALQAEKNHYRAAVLEPVQFSDMSYSVNEIVEKNFKIYETAAKTAALHGADIIVFPECGLFPVLKLNRSLILELAEDIPNPKWTFSNPCYQGKFEDRPILTKLSCLAKENGIFVVANLFDYKNCEFTQACDAEDIAPCTSSDSECPDDGYFFYNTNVVFNREGTLIAKYYKRHLYFEPEVKTPEFPEDVYFQTDFGNFTTVICFDLFYQEAIEAVGKNGVVNLAYPTFWFNHVPLIFFATSLQQAWAMSNKINLLAANVHDPRTGSLGSGIYSARRGALIYTDNPDGRSKLLVSNVPKFIDDDTKDFAVNAKRFFIENDEVIEGEVEEKGNFKNECDIDILGVPTSNLTDYRCKPSPADHYKFVKLEGTEANFEVCSNSFCCSLSYQAQSMNEDYFLGITGKNLNFENTYSYGSEVCFLARCEALNGVPCMNYQLKSRTVFKKVEIKGNFSTQHVLPYAVNSDVRLTDRKQWSFDGKSKILYNNLNRNHSLLFMGLYGRIYDKDQLLDGYYIK